LAAYQRENEDNGSAERMPRNSVFGHRIFHVFDVGSQTLVSLPDFP
jgi:hypothetical protein